MINSTASTDDTHFRVHPRYRLLCVVWLVLVVLFGLDLFRTPSLGIAFFCGVSLVLLIWNGRAALSQVWLTARGVGVRYPGATAQLIEFRQLVSVHESGRLGSAITLVYYPRQANGLLDMDRVSSLFLPTVIDQDELLATLEARTPV